MHQFIEGFVSGLLILALFFIGYLSMKNQKIENQLNAETVKNEDSQTTDKIGNLTDVELDALVTKDLGSSGDVGTTGSTSSVKSK